MSFTRLSSPTRTNFNRTKMFNSDHVAALTERCDYTLKIEEFGIRKIIASFGVYRIRKAALTQSWVHDFKQYLRTDRRRRLRRRNTQTRYEKNHTLFQAFNTDATSALASNLASILVEQRERVNARVGQTVCDCGLSHDPNAPTEPSVWKRTQLPVTVISEK